MKDSEVKGLGGIIGADNVIVDAQETCYSTSFKKVWGPTILEMKNVAGGRVCHPSLSYVGFR